jgi:hypothetical protein
MFSIFKRSPERTHDEYDDDRSLVALVNEARTPEDLNRVLQIDRMRRSR